MEHSDIQLAKRMRTSTGGAASLPFLARSRKEWDSDLRLRSEMQRETDRASASALKIQKPIVPVPEILMGETSELARDDASSDSTSSSTSSSSASSTDSKHSSSGSEIAQPGCQDSDKPWVSPDGRLLHYRLDLSAGMYSKLCQPLKDQSFQKFFVYPGRHACFGIEDRYTMVPQVFTQCVSCQPLSFV